MVNTGEGGDLELMPSSGNEEKRDVRCHTIFTQMQDDSNPRRHPQQNMSAKENHIYPNLR